MPHLLDCPRCGYSEQSTSYDDSALKQLLHKSNSTLSPPLPSPQPSDASTSVSEEVDQLSDLISQLQTRRAALLQQRNIQHSSIYKLPSELLGEIFQYVDAIDRPSGCSFSIPKHRHPLAPIRLGAVSSYWRQVALGSPHLWTQLPLTGCWAWESNFPIAITLRTYFHNLKAQSMELNVDCFRGRVFDAATYSTNGGSGGIPHEDAFNIIFLENADRLRTLGFKMWPRAWLPHIEKVQEIVAFSKLEELCIKSPGADFDGTLSLTHAPRLRKVELAGVDESAIIDLPWPQITHLTLSDVPSYLCLKLFVRCTNLEYFCCSELDTSTPGSRVVSDPITLKHLRTFHYLDHDVTYIWREALGRYFHFPSLESVIWRPDWSAGVEKQILRQYPESIQTLELRFRRRDQPRLKNMFLPLNSLEDLKISCWPSVKLSVLELLTPREDKKLRLLPSLRKLHFTARSNEMTTRVVQALLELIRARRTLTEGKLDHLVLSYYVRPFRLEPWPQEFVEGIREFVRDGMKVELMADDDKVECGWLQDPDAGSSFVPSDFLDLLDSISPAN